MVGAAGNIAQAVTRERDGVAAEAPAIIDGISGKLARGEIRQREACELVLDALTVYAAIVARDTRLTAALHRLSIAIA